MAPQKFHPRFHRLAEELLAEEEAKQTREKISVDVSPEPQPPNVVLPITRNSDFPTHEQLSRATLKAVVTESWEDMERWQFFCTETTPTICNTTSDRLADLDLKSRHLPPPDNPEQSIEYKLAIIYHCRLYNSKILSVLQDFYPATEILLGISSRDKIDDIDTLPLTDSQLMDRIQRYRNSGKILREAIEELTIVTKEMKTWVPMHEAQIAELIAEKAAMDEIEMELANMRKADMEEPELAEEEGLDAEWMARVRKNGKDSSWDDWIASIGNAFQNLSLH